MKLKATTLPERLYLGAVLTLVIGLCSSLWIYVTAEVPLENDMIADYENSKMYMRNLKLYGGQFGVLADEFRRWFSGLWHGKTLAYTIAGMTVFTVLVLYFIASDPNYRKSDPGSPDNPAL